jgi:phosphonate transport system ATP-binding protein
MDALKKINEEDGITVITNLHTLDTAKKYCERLLGMKDGIVVFDGKPEELTVEMIRDLYALGDGSDDEEFDQAITQTSVNVASD